MICRTCGTVIADKAIVCYRCGAPTAEPPAPPAPRRGRPILAAVVVLVLVGAGLLLVPQAPPGAPRVAAFAALALITLGSIRLIRGRRRP